MAIRQEPRTKIAGNSYCNPFCKHYAIGFTAAVRLG